MLDIANTPVARTITLELEQYREPIVESSVPTNRLKIASFVEAVFPGQQIEHLGRSEMAEIKTRKGVFSPSSLFFQAVRQAYAKHHALGLRPEVLMYLITSVVAETVRRYPDDYRHLFTTEAGKVDIQVRHDGLVKGNPDSPWNEAICLFEEGLRPHVPSRVMDQMLPNFTTANNEARVVSLVSFIDAASPFYDYSTNTLCGIPRIVLFGETGDYQRLVSAAKALAQSFAKHLSAYFANLLPVLEEIARTAETGQVDKNFWSQIYKYLHASGTDHFAGWISSFLWYVKEGYGTEVHLEVKNDRFVDWQKIGEGYGIDSGQEPSHVSRVPFTWNYFDQSLPMHFIGGILGVEIADGALTPALSYGVLHAK